MRLLALHPHLRTYLAKRHLTTKFEKQKKLLEENIFHPSLNVEILEPRRLRIFSFRVDRKYRAIFIFSTTETIEIIDINNHYR